MDLLVKENDLKLYEDEWEIYSNDLSMPTQYIGVKAKVKDSLVLEGCIVYGTVENSVLFEGVYVGKNSIIKDSIVMPNSKIKNDIVINKAIIGDNVIIDKNCSIGNGDKIAIISANEHLYKDTTLEPA